MIGPQDFAAETPGLSRMVLRMHGVHEFPEAVLHRIQAAEHDHEEIPGPLRHQVLGHGQLISCEVELSSRRPSEAPRANRFGQRRARRQFGSPGALALHVEEDQGVAEAREIAPTGFDSVFRVLVEPVVSANGLSKLNVTNETEAAHAQELIERYPARRRVLPAPTL